MDYILTATTASPIMLGARRGASQFTPALDYIPAAAMRGALASRVIETRSLAAPHRDREFRALFLDPARVRWGDLTIGGGESTASVPVPATARACKRHGIQHRHSVGDALFYLQAVRATGQSGPIQKWERCTDPPCGEDDKRDRLTGYYYRPEHLPANADDSDNWQHLFLRPTQRLISATAINRYTGAVQPGQLFAHYVLDEGQTFRGRVWIADRDVEWLRPLIDDLLTAFSLRVGAGRSRGFGQLDGLSFDDAPPSPVDTSSFGARWHAFNEAAAEVLNPQGQVGEYFALTLHSPVVLTARQAADPDPVHAVLPIDGVERVRSVVRYITLTGWNDIKGRPKADAIAIARGSVLLYRLTSRNAPAVQAAVSRIDTDGAGLRREEGYGRVIACDPFHSHWLLHS